MVIVKGHAKSNSKILIASKERLLWNNLLWIDTAWSNHYYRSTKKLLAFLKIKGIILFIIMEDHAQRKTPEKIWRKCVEKSCLIHHIFQIWHQQIITYLGHWETTYIIKLAESGCTRKWSECFLIRHQNFTKNKNTRRTMKIIYLIKELEV